MSFFRLEFEFFFKSVLKNKAWLTPHQCSVVYSYGWCLLVCPSSLCIPENFALISVFKPLRICLRRVSVACLRNSSPTKGLLEAGTWLEPALDPFFLGDRIFFLLASSLKSLSATSWRCFVDCASCCIRVWQLRQLKMILLSHFKWWYVVRDPGKATPCGVQVSLEF